jgi:hypothetical protein
MAHRIREAMKPDASKPIGGAKLGVIDKERADKALKGIEGKRVTYRRTNERCQAPSLG